MAVDFTQMDGYQFEDYISNLFRKLGFDVEATNYSNDGGVDLIATFNQPIFSGIYIIQCKNWTGPVGQPEVRDLYGVVMDQRANKGILITPSDYTQQAYDFAKGKNIELINGFTLRRIVSQNPIEFFGEKDLLNNYAFRDERYTYLKGIIEDEPNVVSYYIQLIEYLRAFVKEQNSSVCTIELFDDIIEWTNKMINRCFKTQSKARDKEMAMMIISEALIHSGRLAEATEILLRNNRFWIKDYCSSGGSVYNSASGSFNGYGYHSVYAWNLMAAYNYINYNKGYQLVLSRISQEGKSYCQNLLEDGLYTSQQFGSQFFYPSIRYFSDMGKKTKHLNTSVFFPEDIRNPSFFFTRFLKKSPKEYAAEIDVVLKNHGII